MQSTTPAPYRRLILLNLFCWCSYVLFAQSAIDANFAGGNVIVENVSNDTIYFKPDLTGTKGNWFYWYFRVTNNQPQTVYFKATQPDLLTGLGAAYSTDGGFTWEWIPRDDHLNEDLFVFTFSEPDQTVRLSFGMPYTQKQFDRFIKRHVSDERLQLAKLCQSNKGRDVEKLLLSNFEQDPRFKILLVARAHACEMNSNYLVEGIVEAILSGTPAMENLLEEAEIMIVPFLDKDGVENGDQGKNRIPRDHNRDYSGESLYSTTRTLREEIPDWVGELPWIGIDLHNPWIKNEGNEWIYLVGNAERKIEKQQQIFADILMQSRRGSLIYETDKGFLAYGQSWNNNSNYEQGWPFSKWAASFRGKGLLFTTTLEFPYALNYGQAITQDAARQFGKDLIYALAEYWQRERK